MKLENESLIVERAAAGDRAALEEILLNVKDMAFNLSLRMLGLVPDAEDATQEILIKVMTHIASFRGESSFSTWAYRIAVNHLMNYRKGMFAQRPLSFEIYADDIASGRETDVPDMTGGVDRALLERELKMSCSNVMLQCLDAESRAIYILGTMFRLDSRAASEILGVTPEAYRQRLSRIRKKVGAFLGVYCGLSGTGICACARRTDYAVLTHRLDPANLAFQALDECDLGDVVACTDAMEELDECSQIFAGLPAYRSSNEIGAWLRETMDSGSFQTVLNGRGALA